ncbi:hypothetical protein VTK56DRAFT_1522 [Thermocarpiscus australiensis]
MAPPCQAFPASNLAAMAQLDADGKVRKTEDGRRINLVKDCELLGLVQYDCVVPHPELRDSPVECWPVQRWFRRCRDKKGSFMAETTAWEGTALATTPTELVPPEGQRTQKLARAVTTNSQA